MEYLYLVTALFLVLFSCVVRNTFSGLIVLKLPCLTLAVIYLVLAGKGFGAI